VDVDHVEIIGGSLMVQHYVEEIGQPDHLVSALNTICSAQRSITRRSISRLA
jgi:hypothetical protein